MTEPTTEDTMNIQAKAKALMECYECGGPLAYQAYHHTENVGGVKVNDKTAFANVCTKCGAALLADQELAGYELRAAALVLREKHPVSGSVIRYARKAMGLRQTDLGRHLGHASETVCRWENGAEQVSREAQLAIVALLDAVRDGQVTPEQLREESIKLNDPEEYDVMPLRRACG